MLTNLIQADAALSGSPSSSALPFPSAGPGPSFASTLHSARAPGSPTAQPEAAAVAGRGKSAEKKATENSKTAAAGRIIPGAGSAATADTKSPSVVPVNLASLPRLPQNLPLTITNVGSIPSPVNSGSDAATASWAAAGSTRQVASVGLKGQFQSNTLTDGAGTVLDSGSGTVAAGAGKAMLAGDPPSPPKVAAVAVKPAIPLPVAETIPSAAPPNESGPGQGAPAQIPAFAPNVASQLRAGAAVSDLAVSDTPEAWPSVGEFGGTATDLRTAPGTPSRTALPLSGTNPTSSPTNAVTGDKPSTADGKPQAVDSDAGSVTTTPAPSVMPLGASDPTSNPTNDLTGAKPSTSDDGLQPGNGDLRAVLANLMPVQAKDATSSVVIATAVEPSRSDGNAHSNGGSSPGTLASRASSFSFSGTASSPENLKPLTLPAVTLMKAEETNPSANAHAKGAPTAGATSSEATTSQAPASQVPINQESARLKPADTNVQPISANPIPAFPAGQANGGSQPGTAAATASVFVPVSTAGDPASSSRSAALPAEQQPPQASPPPVLPTAGPVEAARLVAGVAQSEMHIGLRTQAFGSVEVHTVVRDSQVGLTVGSERGDLRTLLATEVSGLQTTFRQQDLHFDSIRFLETTAGTTGGFSGGADSQPRSSSQQHSSPAGFFSIHGPPEDSTEPEVSPGLQTRLNVHA